MRESHIVELNCRRVATTLSLTMREHNIFI